MEERRPMAISAVEGSPIDFGMPLRTVSQFMRLYTPALSHQLKR